VHTTLTHDSIIEPMLHIRCHYNYIQDTCEHRDGHWLADQPRHFLSQRHPWQYNAARTTTGFVDLCHACLRGIPRPGQITDDTDPGGFCVGSITMFILVSCPTIAFVPATTAKITCPHHAKCSISQLPSSRAQRPLIPTRCCRQSAAPHSTMTPH